MKVLFAETAEADLEIIGDWIAEDDPHRAANFLMRLRDRCHSLSSRPKRFPVVRYVRGAAIRKLSYKDYLIFYVVLPNRVEIMHVMHGARDWMSL